MGLEKPTYDAVLAAIFGEDFNPQTVHETSFKGDPHSPDEGRWHGRRVAGRRKIDGAFEPVAPDDNHYICMALLDPNTKGRSLRAVAGHVAFWMDDVGTKAPREKIEDFINSTGLKPVLVTQTSPDNYSYFWSFAAPIPEAPDSFDAQLVAAVRHHLKIGRWGDPATQEAARYMRSGFGVNGKAAYRGEDGTPFALTIEHFDPSARLTRAGIEKFAEAIIGPNWRDEVTSGRYLSSAALAAQNGNNERRATMDMPLVRLAAAAGLDPRPSTRAGVIDCHCPNEAAHTGGDPTGYAFINDGMSYCNHASCQHLNSADFQDMIIERYEAQVQAGIAFGTIMESPFDGSLVDQSGNRVQPTGAGFLAACRFEQAGGSEGEGVAELRSQAEDLAQRQTHEAAAREEARETALSRLFERFVWVSAPEMFWDREINELITASRLDRDEEVLRSFKLVNGDKRASNQLLNTTGRMTHATTVVSRPYRADAPPSSDIVMVDGPGGQIRAVNSFRPTNIGFRQGTPTAYLQHLDYLFGNQPETRTYLLEYMAFRIQNPGAKTTVIPLIGGAPGIGKDVPLLQPFFKLLGTHNVREITASKLISDYNDFLLSPTIYMGEFSLAGHDGAKAYDRLKDMTSPNPVPATINPKYGKTFRTEVSPCFIATTNNEDALEVVPSGDRRFLIAWSDAVRLHGPHHGTGPGTDAYYDWLTAEYDDSTGHGRANLEILHNYLMTLPITMFHPHKSPPRTAKRHETLVASLSGTARFVYELVAEGELANRKVVSFEEIEQHCLGAENLAVRNKVYPRAIAAGLSAAGCKKIDRVSVGGKRVQLWTGSCVVLGDGTRLQGAITQSEQQAFLTDKSLAGQTYVSEKKAAADAGQDPGHAGHGAGHGVVPLRPAA